MDCGDVADAVRVVEEPGVGPGDHISGGRSADEPISAASGLGFEKFPKVDQNQAVGREQKSGAQIS